jgi:hypothetical protein
MSNDLTPDDAPELYLTAYGIWRHCREQMLTVDPNDDVFNCLAALCVLAKIEMEKQTCKLPF